MKPNHLPLCILAAAVAAGMASCDPINAEQELEHYTKCVSVVTDNTAGSIYVDTESSYSIKGDFFNSTFAVECRNVTFYPGAPALTAKVSGLNQYYNSDSTYVFMLQRESSYSSGGFQPDSLRYAKYGNIWITYFAGNSFADSRHYTVNVVPTDYNVESDSVMVYKSLANWADSHTIYQGIGMYTRYNLHIDPETSTLDIKINGQKFSSTDRPNEYYLRGIPVTFTTDGYRIEAAEVKAYDLKGNPLPALNAYRLSGLMTTAPEGVKQFTYYFRDTTAEADTVVPDRRVFLNFYNHSMAQQ